MDDTVRVTTKVDVTTNSIWSGDDESREYWTGDQQDGSKVAWLLDDVERCRTVQSVYEVPVSLTISGGKIQY